MKKYMIRCDLEGVSGIVSYDQVNPDKPEYKTGQALFMNDLLALLDGLNNGGADEIVIFDMHYYGRNIVWDKVPDNVSVICGKPLYKDDWAGGLDGTFTGLILLGLHSKSGTPGGLLNHSYDMNIKDILINGISVGEIGIESAIAGEIGVPLILVTGDSAGIQEAQKLIPGVANVIVKESIDENSAICYPLSRTAKMISEKAEEVARNKTPAQPFALTKPVLLEVELQEGKYLDTFRRKYGNDMRGNKVVIEGKSVIEVWSACRKKMCANN